MPRPNPGELPPIPDNLRELIGPRTIPGGGFTDPRPDAVEPDPALEEFLSLHGVHVDSGLDSGKRREWLINAEEADDDEEKELRRRRGEG